MSQLMTLGTSPSASSLAPASANPLSTIRSDGVESFQAMIRRHVTLTQELAALVEADPRFEIVAPHPLNLLCLAVASPDSDSDSDSETDSADQLIDIAGHETIVGSVKSNDGGATQEYDVDVPYKLVDGDGFEYGDVDG